MLLFYKEFVVKIPEDNYKAGGYIQIEIPETEVNYKDMDITAKNMTQLINLKRNGINSIYGH